MLQAYGYSEATQTLAVRFGPGKVYQYKGVPQDIYDQLAKSESIGSAFARLIRNSFPYDIVQDTPEEKTPSEATE